MQFCYESDAICIYLNERNGNTNIKQSGPFIFCRFLMEEKSPLKELPCFALPVPRSLHMPTFHVFKEKAMKDLNNSEKVGND